MRKPTTKPGSDPQGCNVEISGTSTEMDRWNETVVNDLSTAVRIPQPGTNSTNVSFAQPGHTNDFWAARRCSVGHASTRGSDVKGGVNSPRRRGVHCDEGDVERSDPYVFDQGR